MYALALWNVCVPFCCSVYLE